MGSKTYYERKAAGLCVRCGKVHPADGMVVCLECRQKYNLYRKGASRERREYLKKIHVCPKCGREKLYEGEKTCPDCLEKQREYHRVWSRNHKEKVREYQKNYRDRCAAKGLCIQCGKPAENGKMVCRSCMRKRVQNIRRRKNEKVWIPREDWAYCGLCYICGRPAADGSTTCADCAEKSRKRFEKNVIQRSRKTVTAHTGEG